VQKWCAERLAFPRSVFCQEEGGLIVTVGEIGRPVHHLHCHQSLRLSLLFTNVTLHPSSLPTTTM
jgi:hypothetical protein